MGEQFLERVHYICNHRSLTIYSHTYIHIYTGFHSLTGDGDEVSSTWNEVCESFDEMGLHENLLRGIYAYGKI
jgi:hypothetical protein